MAGRSYNPIYATTTGDALGYNERAGENSVYETFRALYANPTKATVDARAYAREKKEQTAQCISAIHAGQRNNLLDLSAGARKTAEFNSLVIDEPSAGERACAAAPAQSVSYASGFSATGRDGARDRSRSRERAEPVPGCESISKRLPDSQINKHLPGYGGFVPTTHFLGTTYGTATARAIVDVRSSAEPRHA